MGKLEKIIDGCFKLFAATALIVMVGLVFYNAILRYVFNSGMPAAEEISRFMFVWLSFLGIVVANKTGSHVSVTIVTDKLKGTPAVVVRVLKEIAVLITMSIILYGGINYTLTSNYSTPATQTPFMLVTSATVIMAVSVLVMSVATIIRDIRAGSKDKETKDGVK